MTSTDLSKALSLVPEIKAAHEEAEKCQRSSHGRALEYAIKAGDALILAKEAVGHGAFSIWRQQNLPHIPSTTATLYMRLAEHKDKFRDGNIGNTVADLSAKGELSLRKAAALLPKRPQTATQIAAAKARAEAKAAASKTNEGMVKEWLKPLDVDQLVFVLKEVFDADYIGRLAKALIPSMGQASMGPSITSNVLVRRA
jgi:hypothetical protein